MPAPPLPFIPAEWVGKQVAVVTLCCVGDLQRAQAMVAPLRQLGTPIADVTAPMPYPGMFQLTAEGAVPHPLAVRSGYLTGLDEGAIEAILEGSAAMPVPAGMIQLRALGGAMARVPAQASAFGHRDKPYLAMVLGIAPRLEVLEAQRAWATESWDALRAYREGSYTNFLQDEGAERVREAYSPSTYARLVDIKRRYDPYNVFRLNQNIAPDAD
jgi:FAD/FMN-containing dehydrogenase